MKLLIDAKILFAALIKESLTAELLIRDKVHPIVPEFLFIEFSKHREYILEKAHHL